MLTPGIVYSSNSMFLVLSRKKPANVDALECHCTNVEGSMYCLGCGNSVVGLMATIREAGVPAMICEKINTSSDSCCKYRSILLTDNGANYTYCKLIDAYVAKVDWRVVTVSV